MQFEPGKSGNPNGRPKGSANRKTQLTTLLEPHAESLINKAVELALDGDVNALRLCIERLIPKAKDEPVKIVIPDFSSLHNYDIAKVILELLSGQELNLSELKNLISFTSNNNNAGFSNHEEILKLLK